MEIEKYKYEEYLIAVREEHKINCPCEKATPKNSTAFRWVHSDINHENNFLPPGIIAIKQKRKPRIFPPNQKENYCNIFALSLFDTENNAIKRFKNFPKRIQKMLGFTNVAMGEIETNDGVLTGINSYGHFDLHEFEEASLVSKFTIKKELLS